MKARLALTILVLSISSCTRTETAFICQISATPDAYFGKHLYVSGEIYSSRHDAALVDAKCPPASLALGARGKEGEAFYATAMANGPDRATRGRYLFAAVAGTCTRAPEVKGCYFIVDRALYTKVVIGKPGIGR